MDNTVDEAKDPYFKALLDKGSKRAEDFIEEETFTQSDLIQESRQAFSKFKTKKRGPIFHRGSLKTGKPGA
ncbi:MAG: hypothetical protein V8T37_01480 [Streptococcus sp.]